MNIFISFGFRCDTSLILRKTLYLQNESLPFDWVQLSIDTQINIIKLYLNKDSIENFYNNLFGDTFNFNEKKSIDGSWFPHDEFEDKSIVIQKYIRRTNRLFSLLDKSERKIFLTIFQWNENNSNTNNVTKLIDTLNGLKINDYLLITINGLVDEKINEKNININVPFRIINGNDSDYISWEQNIIIRLKELEYFIP